MSVITPHQMETALRDWLGDRVHFEDGWRSRTSNGPFDAHGMVSHWTAMRTKPSGGHRAIPVYAQRRVLRIGTSALNGPLAHLSTTPGGHVWVIAGPRSNANHAGSGDYDIYRRILAGDYDGSPLGTAENFNGNNVFYGREDMYHPDDGVFPDEQFEAGVLSFAALAQAHGWGPKAAGGSCLDHYEWASRRKWDRQIQNLADRTRREVTEAVKEGPGMAISNRDARRIAKAVLNEDSVPVPANVGYSDEYRKKNPFFTLRYAVSHAWDAAERARIQAREDQDTQSATRDQVRDVLHAVKSLNLQVDQSALDSDDIVAAVQQALIKGTGNG